MQGSSHTGPQPRGPRAPLSPPPEMGQSKRGTQCLDPPALGMVLGVTEPTPSCSSMGALQPPGSQMGLGIVLVWPLWQGCVLDCPFPFSLLHRGWKSRANTLLGVCASAHGAVGQFAGDGAV